MQEQNPISSIFHKHFKFILSISMIFMHTGCSSGGDERKATEFAVPDTVAMNANTGKVNPDTNSIIINGSNIWVRDKPSTGNVIMKLNNGDTCSIIEKGKPETIRGTHDYWYKISCFGDTGWVFGSQTSLRMQNPNDETKNVTPKSIPEQQDTAIRNIIGDFLSFIANSHSLDKYLHDDLGLFQAHNPGAMCMPKSIAPENIRLPENTDLPVQQDIPNGDLCFGYPDAEDGYYYDLTDEIPAYPEFNDNNEIVLIPVDVPVKKIDKIAKLILIEEEMAIMTFFFASVSGKWYLFGQDICDCSA